MLVKNTYGASIIPRKTNPNFLGQCRGSSLDRKKKETDKTESLKGNDKEAEALRIKKRRPKLRSLSSRTKTKIKKKLYSLAGLNKKLTFLTLTFLNKVEDKLAVELLGKFLDNVKKQDKDFEFLWVAERQTKNAAFEGNIHFHLVSNKYWNIEKYWQYWLSLQNKAGLLPRDENFKPTSAFDVKTVTSKNSKALGTYLTKYVTKNNEKFKCQVWNCSKKISRLYTDFYDNGSVLSEVERLEDAKEIDVKRVQDEYSKANYYPVNKTTIRFYNKLHEKNKEMWSAN